VRAGLEAIVEREPDLALVGSAASEHELWALLGRTRPAVVVLDLHHPGRDGMALALRIKRRRSGPRVVLYSASADGALLVPATLAGVDAIVDKSRTADDLVAAIRAVARDGRALAPVSLRARGRAAALLEPALRPILAMRLAGTAPEDIAATLGLAPWELARRMAAIVARLTSAVA
jgi:DNA-binding NarL/FixJ family response regulator